MLNRLLKLLGEEASILRQGIHANYAPGSWGPKAADMMLMRDGRAWHNPE